MQSEAASTEEEASASLRHSSAARLAPMRGRRDLSPSAIASYYSSDIASPRLPPDAPNGIPIELDLFSVSSQAGDSEIGADAAGDRSSHAMLDDGNSDSDNDSESDTRETSASMKEGREENLGWHVGPAGDVRHPLEGSERKDIKNEWGDQSDLYEGGQSSLDHKSVDSRLSGGTFVLLDDIIDAEDPPPSASVAPPETQGDDARADQSASVDAASPASLAASEDVVNQPPPVIDQGDRLAARRRVEHRNIEDEAASTRSTVSTSITDRPSLQSPQLVRASGPSAVQVPLTETLRARDDVDGLIWPDTANEVIHSLAARFPWPAAHAEDDRECSLSDKTHPCAVFSPHSPGLSTLDSDPTTGTASVITRPPSASSSHSSPSSDKLGIIEAERATPKEVQFTLSPSPVSLPPRFGSGHPSQALHSRTTSQSGWTDAADFDTDTRSLFAVAEGYHVHLALSEETRQALEIELRERAKSVPDLLLVGGLDPTPAPALSTVEPAPPRGPPPTSLPVSPSTPRTPSPTSLRNRVRARARERHLSMAGSPSPPVSPYASEPLPALPIPPPRNRFGYQEEEEGEVVVIERRVNKSANSHARVTQSAQDSGLGSPWSPSASTRVASNIGNQGIYRGSNGKMWSPPTTAASSGTASTGPPAHSESLSGAGPFPPVPSLSRSSDHSTPGDARSSTSSYMMSPESVSSMSSFGDVVGPGQSFYGGRFTSPRTGVSIIDTIQEERGSPDAKTLADLDAKGSHGYNVAWGVQRDLANASSPSVMIAPTDRAPAERAFPPSSFTQAPKSQRQGPPRAEEGSWSIADYPDLLSAGQGGLADGTAGGKKLAIDRAELAELRQQAEDLSRALPGPAPDSALSSSSQGLSAEDRGPPHQHIYKSPRDLDRSYHEQLPYRPSERDSSQGYAHRNRRENLSYSSGYSASSHPFSATSSRSGGPGGYGRRPSISVGDGPHPFASQAFDSNASDFPAKSAGALRTAPVHQVALVDEMDTPIESDEVCPICVESLSSTYRLPGEKSHVTPVCGHSLHHECFVTVYGPVPESAMLLKRTNFGMCGVCRKPMQLLDEDEFGGGLAKPKQSSKFAAMTGMSVSTIGGANGTTNSSRSGMLSSTSVTSLGSLGQQSDATGDDPLDGMPVSSAPKSARGPSDVVIPSIAIKPEHSSLVRRNQQGSGQVLTCLITVEAPSAGMRPSYASPSDVKAPALPQKHQSKPAADRSTSISMPSSTPDPFVHVAADLQYRLIDYKTSGLDSLGPIKLYDILRVRKGSFVMQIYVYLFEQAIICVSEEKKKGLRGLLSSQSSGSLKSVDGRDRGKRDKTPLKLTGRIYLHHVKRVVDSTVQGELSLTIAMQDEALDSFILTFTDRSSLEMWRTTLQRLLGHDEAGASSAQNGGLKTATSSSSVGGKLAKMGFDDATLAFATNNAHSPTIDAETRQSYDFAPSDFGPPLRQQTHGNRSSAARASEQLASPTSPPETSTSRSRFGVAPLAPQHTPLDLLIVTSLPPRSGAGSTSSPMKQRLILTTLEFIMALLGPRDRLSLVAFEPWQGGRIRRTPLLCPAKAEGRRKLEKFLDIVDGATEPDPEQDNYIVEGSGEERVDVVAGVNAGLDILMQRRAKNSLTGMVLVSDTAESIKRSQMDLLLARAEAANVPIHSMGYGKNQDPSALWLMSSHTHGTYTFVKEWYDLRDCMAGIVGGMLSVAITGMKIHLSAREASFRCRKVSGAISHVVSSDGKDIDVELKELQYGQRVEFLVEMEFESNSQRASGDSTGQYHPGVSDEGHDAASHRYSSVRSFGKASNYTNETYSAHAETNGHSDSLLMMSDDRLVDEIPVFDLDCSYRDPAAARSVARLSHPILLTVALLPASATMPMSSDLGVVRRRYELLASESITRCLLLVARSNWPQAERLMQETTRILSTIIGQLSADPARGPQSALRARREAQSKATMRSLQAVLGDIDALLEGMEEHRDMFERDHRNFGAQQAMVLRNQKSWSERTPTESLYCLEGSLQAVRLSQGWQIA